MERNRVGESWLTGTVSSIGLSGCPDGRLVRLQSLRGRFRPTRAERRNKVHCRMQTRVIPKLNEGEVGTRVTE